MKKQLSALVICSVLMLPSAVIAEGTESTATPSTAPATTGTATTQPAPNVTAPAGSTATTPPNATAPVQNSTGGSVTPVPSGGGTSGQSGGTSSFKTVKTKMTNFHHHWKGNNVQSLLKKEYKN